MGYSWVIINEWIDFINYQFNQTTRELRWEGWSMVNPIWYFGQDPLFSMNPWFILSSVHHDIPIGIEIIWNHDITPISRPFTHGGHSPMLMIESPFNHHEGPALSSPGSPGCRSSVRLGLKLLGFQSATSARPMSATRRPKGYGIFRTLGDIWGTFLSKNHGELIMWAWVEHKLNTLPRMAVFAW